VPSRGGAIFCNRLENKHILEIMLREDAPHRGEVKPALRRDIIGLVSALGIAVLLVLFLDTGALADWVSKHKDTKIDEIIVVTMMLVIALGFLSKLELSRQLKNYERLYDEMTS
jgi:hypothetical protein